jgi:hypothetical protein
VAGITGKYYLFSVFNGSIGSFFARYTRMTRNGNAWAGIILVVLAIVGGFLIVGSPAKQRAIRFDEQRVNDLTTIQYQIIDYWQAKGALPAALSDLDDPVSNFTVPNDPETATPYDYSIKNSRGSLAFELCATFDLPSSKEPSDQAIYNSPMIPAVVGGATNADWDHAAGHACFDRTVDTDRYPAAVPKPL